MTESPKALREKFRAGWVPATTAGLAPNHVQANLVAVPREHAEAFELWCRRNPKPCPIIAIGDRAMPRLGVQDIATDLPRYRVWHDGKVTDEPTDVAAVWQDDLVSFALGCSYSFDAALAAAGVRLRHVEQGINPPIYGTAVQTKEAGPFGGALIVAMRPLTAEQALLAAKVTAPLKLAHGAPIHTGDPMILGIELDDPLNDSPLRPEAGELPVFWACGVTPENALRRAKLPFAITHYPGAMLITDLTLDDIAA